MTFIIVLIFFIFICLQMTLIYFVIKENLTSLQASIMNKLSNANSWLCVNKHSFDIDKNN